MEGGSPGELGEGLVGPGQEVGGQVDRQYSRLTCWWAKPPPPLPIPNEIRSGAQLSGLLC